MKSASKLKDEARKLEQREEWERAIHLYLQVLRGGADEDGVGEADLPLYNRVGDLYIRLGQPAEAVKYYEQAADQYADAGLFNNAIALCNKALRYQPTRLGLFRKLGQFCARQGFLTDARRWYLEFADRMFKSGQLDEAFSALDDFAGISDDPDVRLHLGRQLHAYQRDTEGIDEFRRAYATHVRAGDADAAEAVRKEALELFENGPDFGEEDAVAPIAPLRPAEAGTPALPTFGDAPLASPTGDDTEAPDTPSDGMLEGFVQTQLSDDGALADVGSTTLPGLETGRDDTLERMAHAADEVADADADGPAALPLIGEAEDAGEDERLPLLGDRAAASTPVEPEFTSREASAPSSVGSPVAASDEDVDLYALLAPEEDRVETTRFFIQESEPTGDEDHDFAQLLKEFRAKLAEHVPENDAGSHYDLGLAFKEMGLIDDAISEFQIALRAGQDRLKVFEELGQCFILKDQHNIAVKVLSRALQFEHRDELELIAVYYHLGRAYEALGQTHSARDAYERVMGLDIRFEDVQDRVLRL